jgi:hypothetical protein
MQVPHQMTTLTEVMEKLRTRKYDTEFRWSEAGFSAGKGKSYQPDELEIIKVYRFEEITNPSDMSVLYVIQAKDGLVGYTLNAYGVYSNHDNEAGYDNFIRQIPEKGHEDQLLFEL